MGFFKDLRDTARRADERTSDRRESERQTDSASERDYWHDKKHGR